MNAYTSFAQVYDLFMDNVPYRKWCDYLDAKFREYGLQEPIVLDLGCGTGKMTRMMAERGYDMIGVDNSSEMLDIARELEYEALMEREQQAWEQDSEEDMDEEGPDAGEVMDTIDESILAELDEEYYDGAYSGEKSPTLYLCQDMRELELYGTIGACYCACDSLNYLLEEADLLQVFRLVNNYLFPKGLFIFDINTPYKYEKLLADNTIAETREEGSFIWENNYDPENRINIYDLTLFIREDQLEDQLEEVDQWEIPADLPYYRFQETHYQKCYPLETIRQLLEEAGMEFIAAYDSYSDDPVKEDSEKITIIARECGKPVIG